MTSSAAPAQPRAAHPSPRRCPPHDVLQVVTHRPDTDDGDRSGRHEEGHSRSANQIPAEGLPEGLEGVRRGLAVPILSGKKHRDGLAGEANIPLPETDNSPLSRPTDQDRSTQAPQTVKANPIARRESTGPLTPERLDPNPREETLPLPASITGFNPYSAAACRTDDRVCVDSVVRQSRNAEKSAMANRTHRNPDERCNDQES